MQRQYEKYFYKPGSRVIIHQLENGIDYFELMIDENLYAPPREIIQLEQKIQKDGKRKPEKA